MSSSSDRSTSQFPNEPFHSAQRPQNLLSVMDKERDSASEKSSDASSDAIMGGQKSPDESKNRALHASALQPLRPNKFHGSASTWRNWTAPERELATSLDQLVAKDLGMHLYNVFKLKQRKEHQDERLHSQISQGEDDAADRDDWKPPNLWTAWPLPPEIVPREEDDWHWEDKPALPAPYIVRPKMPGDALRELMVAQVLRKARFKFAKRESDDVDIACGAPVSLKLVVMADDERASAILRPTVQDILTKLDALLMGLHHARGAVCLPMDDTASQYRSRSRRRQGSQESASRTKSRSMSKAEDGEALCDNPSACNIHERKSRLGLRDWSDVLGIATMTDWDSAVVEKAAARCTSIFEESIKFRTLEEDLGSYTERRYLDGTITSMTSPEAIESMDTTADDEDGMLGGVHVDGYLEPIEGKKAWKYTKESSKRGRGRSRSKQ